MAAPEPTPAAPPPTAPAAAPRRPRLLLRSLAAGLFSLLLAAALLAATIGWLIGTASGMSALIALANRFAPLHIEAKGAYGALVREFGFAELVVTVADTRVSATAVGARLRALSWEPPRIDFAHLEAATLRVEVKTDPEPSEAVQDIGIAVHLSSPTVRIGTLTIAVDEDSFSLQDIAGSAVAGPQGYRIDDGRVAYGAQRAEVSASLGALRPFAFEAQGRLAAQLQDQAIGAAVRAHGSLVEMTVEGEVSGPAQGKVVASIASFDRPPVRSLTVDLAGVNPRDWHPQAPIAELAISGELTPNGAMDRVAGSLSVANRAPGLVDAGRIPVRSATARIELLPGQVRFERIDARLTQGSARGDFAFVHADDRWQANARLADVDPASLHGALQPMRIDGSISARQAAAEIVVSADLEHRGKPEARLELDGRVNASLATINSARLHLGDGYATAAGRIELTGRQQVDLRGELHRFEPGRLVKGVDARLTGSLLVDGALHPRPSGRLRFEIADSHAWSRPLAGGGRVDLDAAQHLDVDVDLRVHSARLVAKGGLGGPDRSLEVMLDVPAVAELLPPARQTAASGRVMLSATARGEWAAPALQVSAAADDLRYGDHGIAKADAQASYGGGSDGALQVSAGAAGYSNASRPRAKLQALSLVVEGRLSKHAIKVQATADRAQSALIIADGGWLDEAWRGRVREAVAAPPLDLRLLTPASLVIGGHGVEFGPAQVAIQQVLVEDVRVRSDESGLTTQGRFDNLQPTRFSVPVEGALTPIVATTGERPALTLRGEWNLKLAGDVADGHLQIDRSSGDLYAGRGADSALGLSDAWLTVRITANRLEASTRIEAMRGGGLGAHMNAWLENSPDAGWRLAPMRPWLISGAFDLATMDWVNALLSDNVRANVRLGGRLASTVRIEGTPAKPSAVGRLTGSELRVAWVEQGVRLENGRLLAHLQDDLIVLDELAFSGPPRVRPDDRRAAAAVPADLVGKVSADGRLKLGDFSGVIQVAASHLPLLQRPDRWVIASGGGNIEISERHVQLNGAFAAEAGFVGLTRAELPSLSDDVVVVRAGDDAETRARRVSLGFDLGIDLGSAFYLSGRGLNTRVEGALRLRSAGRGAVTAIGSIEAVDGTYEGFGQRLRIARGRLNFQGAPDNPGLDILALRTGLPVEVGVTITRTAASPLVRMHSDPPMADAEALSWLVLGRPPDQGGGDNIALAQAAAGLLSGSSEGYSTRVAKAIGVDEISIRSGTFGIASLLPARGVAGSLRSDEASAATVAGEIITIGKNINEALTLSYQQAISDTTRFLQLNYRLSQRLSVVARGGTNNALDLVYSFAFD